MEDDLTTKERIYLNVIRKLVGAASGNGGPSPMSDCAYFDYQDPSVGDVALAASSGIHPFTIGRVVEVHSGSEMTIRELGGEEECRVGNEIFYTLEGFDESIFWGGRSRKIAQKVHKAFKRGRDGGYGHEPSSSAYYYRSRDLEFLGESSVVVTIGAHAWVSSRGLCRFDVELDVNPSDSTQSVLDQLLDAGFGNDLEEWPGRIVEKPDDCSSCGSESMSWNPADEIWECSECESEPAIYSMGHAPTGQ